jgi:hypothetical protein
MPSARAPMPAPQMIETPAMRRSALLAKMLEQQRQPTEIKGGYGELGARLLAQGITQWGANRAEKAARGEREQQLAGIRDNVLGDLAAFSSPDVAPSGVALGAALSQPSPITNTQEPREAETAPLGVISGSPMPPAVQAPTSVEDALLSAPQPQAAPQPVAPVAQQQAPRNPLGPTPGQIAMITEAVNSSDPARVAWGQQLWGEIQMQMAENPALRREYQAQNGVGGSYDPITNEWVPMAGGVPEVARNRTFLADEGNDFGVPPGTLLSITPTGVISVVNRQETGLELVGGELRPQMGGSRDLNAADRRFAELTNLRKEIDPIIDSATLLQRNIQALRAGSRAQNGAGDIAMINGLQKLIDEGVVREGDVALQLQAQGINGGIAGLQGYLTSSGRFSPAIRNQLLATGEDIYRNMNAVYRDRVLSYEPLVTSSFGADAFNDVLPSRTRDAFGWGAGEAPSPRPQPRNNRPAALNRPRQPAPASPSAADVQAEMRRRGLL